jgi:hypothetical protein
MQNTERRERINGHADDRLVFALEPDQTVAEASRPLPRYVLGRGTNMILWGLRIFVLIITVMVVCTFVISLKSPP